MPPRLRRLLHRAFDQFLEQAGGDALQPPDT